MNGKKKIIDQLKTKQLWWEEEKGWKMPLNFKFALDWEADPVPCEDSHVPKIEQLHSLQGANGEIIRRARAKKEAYMARMKGSSLL